MMKKFVFKMCNVFVRSVNGSWVLGLLAVAACSIPLSAEPCPPGRAMWIYECPYDVVRDRDERDEVFRFAESHGINEFFLSVSFNCSLDGTCNVCPPGDESCRLEGPSYRGALRLVLRKAHNRRIRVHALFGHPRFALQENHPQVRARIQAILEFNRRSQPDQTFDGIHLDVEPHLMNRQEYGFEYSVDPIGTLRQFLDMNATVVDALAGKNVSHGVDIPFFWHPYVNEFGELDLREDLLMDYGGRRDYPTYHLMDMVKEIAIMAYRRNPATTIRWTEFAIDHAAQTEVQACVYVGVQTSPPEPEERCGRRQRRQCRETFACNTQGPCAPSGCGTREGECAPCGQNFMEEELSTIDREFRDVRGYHSFRGFSFFKYGSYRDMPE